MLDADEPDDVVNVVNHARDRDGGQPRGVLALAHAVAGDALRGAAPLGLAARLLDERRDLGVHALFLLLPARLDERRVEDDADDPARLRDRADHLVRQVARDVDNRPAVRVRGDDGFGRGLEDVPEGLVRDVRDVNQHAEPAHLADDPATEVVESARPAFRVAGRAGPTQTVSPRRRHVAHAHLVVAPDRFEFFVNRVAAFESHERGELIVRGGAADVRGGGERPDFGVLFGEGADGRDLLVGARDGARPAAPVELRLDPDGEELRVEAALAHARGVEVRGREPAADVRALVNDELHGVGVHIHGDGAAVDRRRVGGGGSLACRARRRGSFVCSQFTLLSVAAAKRKRQQERARARGQGRKPARLRPRSL